MSTGLKASKLIGLVRGNSIITGPFTTSDPYDYENNLLRSYEILTKILNFFREQLEKQWFPESINDFSYFCSNVGIRALLLTLSDVAEHIGLTNNVDLSNLETSEVVSKFLPFVRSITDYFATTEDKELKAKWSKSGSSSALIVEHSKELGRILNNFHSDFEPAWFTDYLQEEQNTIRNEANNLVANIERKLFKFVKLRLEEKFGVGENEWYGKGIPESVRLKCAERFEKDGRIRGVETYIDLIDYRKICEDNWGLFHEIISLGLDCGNRKSDRTKWINDVNAIRNRISHHTREDITNNDVSFLRDVWGRVEVMSSK